MNHQQKYILGSIIYAPVLPIVYLQGQWIKKTVPRLPEAEGIEGEVVQNKNSKDTFRLLCLGESTMAGVGAKRHEDAVGGSIAKELSENFNTNVYWRVYARNGYTAKRLRYKILPKIVERDFDLIVIALGGNDAFALNSPQTWRENLLGMLKDTQKLFPETPIVFMNMPPIHEFPAFTRSIKWTVGGLVRLLGEELKLAVADLKDVYYSEEVIQMDSWQKKYNIAGNRTEFFSDGVHPSELAYQVWAKDLVDFIVKKEIIKDL